MKNDPKTVIPQEQPVGRALSRAGKNFLFLLNHKLSVLDLERNYYALIIIEKRSGEVTQNELAQELETDKVSVVRIVEYLMKKDLIRKARGEKDRRKYFLFITEKAKAQLPIIKKAINEITEIAFQGLSEQEKAEFLSLLGRIKYNLYQEIHTIL
jgi:MarR family transcriptional regulator, transcriptional regulator for hemolysin